MSRGARRKKPAAPTVHDEVSVRRAALLAKQGWRCFGCQVARTGDVAWHLHGDRVYCPVCYEVVA